MDSAIKSQTERDAAMIGGIAEGDEAVIKAVYGDFKDDFISWAVRKFSISREDAKDIYQNTMVALYENCRDSKVTHRSSSLKTYLFAIGKNKTLELLQRQKKSVPLHSEDFLAEDPVSEEEAGMEEKEKLNKMLLCLDGLGEPCRTLLNLFYFQKKSMEEIAGILRYSNSDTAKNLKYKCLNRLRKLYKEE